MKRKLARNTIYYETTQRLDKINKPHNEIGSRPKLEHWYKRAQGPTNIKVKQVTRTKWRVYTINSSFKTRKPEPLSFFPPFSFFSLFFYFLLFIFPLFSSLLIHPHSGQIHRRCRPLSPSNSFSHHPRSRQCWSAGSGEPQLARS